MMKKFLFDLFGRVRLHLDSQHILFTNELFGLKFHRTQTTQRQHIRKLVYSRKRFEIDLSTGTRVEVKPQLIIWAGLYKYQLAGASGVINSEPETEWLAQELSDWLNIPITRE